MSLIHGLSAFAKGGVGGLQAAQRDWSPYVVHFTSWAEMKPIRAAISEGKSASDIDAALKTADSASLKVALKICKSGKVIAKAPGTTNDGLPKCVCLSECNLPGLLAHAERYGRFGFVFTKESIFKLAGAPCLYLRTDEYTEISKAFKDSTNPAAQRIWGLSNFYSPPGSGNKVQDFTHEREWRVFADIDIASTPPHCLLAPYTHVSCLMGAIPGVPVLPIDTLFEWGA